MQEFSEKEYELLKKESAEIRSYITRVIGLIVTLAGLSGYLIEFAIKISNPISELLIITISMVIITMLFKVIWYKFKSHNRYTGYIQLLMQELNYIDKSKASKDINNLKSKKYIRDYRKYCEGEKGKTTNIFSWEFMLSRFNSSSLWYPIDQKEEEKTIVKASRRSMYVFALPDRYDYKLFKNNSYESLDESFLEQIIYPIYKKKESKTWISWYLVRCLWESFLNLFRKKDKKKFIYGKKNLELDKKYLVSGWKYPKLITQIAFSAISCLFVSFLFIYFSELKLISWNEFSWKSTIAPLLFAGVLVIFYYWIYHFINGLKDISFGQNSIDGYCWTFFLYRVQFLNSKVVLMRL